MTRIDLWNKFCSSGSVNDYLIFRSECVRQEEEKRADSDKRNRDSLKEHG